VVPAVVAALASAMFLPAAAVALAVLVLTVGANASRRLLTLGAVVLFGAVLLAGATEAPTAFVLAGAGATVVAWDAGTNAVTVGRQFRRRGRHPPAGGRPRLATTGVAAVVGIVGFGAFRLASGGQPTVGVALLLLAALLFSYLLDSAGDSGSVNVRSDRI